MKFKKYWKLFKQDIKRDFKFGISHLEKREKTAAVLLGFVLVFAMFYLLLFMPSCCGC